MRQAITSDDEEQPLLDEMGSEKRKNVSLHANQRNGQKSYAKPVNKSKTPLR